MTANAQASSATFALDTRRWSSAAIVDLDAPMSVESQPLSQQRLEELASADPDELFRVVQDDGLAVPLLTYAAEALGMVPATHFHQAAQLLRRLLAHDHAVVREGAVYGIAGIAERSPAVLAFLEPMNGPDEPSPGVRAAVADILDRSE